MDAHTVQSARDQVVGEGRSSVWRSGAGTGEGESSASRRGSTPTTTMTAVVHRREHDAAGVPLPLVKTKVGFCGVLRPVLRY